MFWFSLLLLWIGCLGLFLVSMVLGIYFAYHRWEWTCVEPQLWPWTWMFLDSGEGGATFPDIVFWSHFFFRNCATSKVAKPGMAMVRLRSGRRLGSLQCCWTWWGIWCRSGKKLNCETRKLEKVN
jgi:hypothetical protein